MTKPGAEGRPVDDIDEIEAKLAELNPVQAIVLQMVAEWEKPAAILAAVTPAVADKIITLSWVKKVCSDKCRPDWARPIVAHFRQQFLQERDKTPCRHLAYRLRKLQEVIDGAHDARVTLQALREAHEQSGDKVEKVADVSEEMEMESLFAELDGAGPSQGDREDG